jgi:hypothetical protein
LCLCDVPFAQLARLYNIVTVSHWSSRLDRDWLIFTFSHLFLCPHIRNTQLRSHVGEQTRTP